MELGGVALSTVLGDDLRIIALRADRAAKERGDPVDLVRVRSVGKCDGAAQQVFVQRALLVRLVGLVDEEDLLPGEPLEGGDNGVELDVPNRRRRPGWSRC